MRLSSSSFCAKFLSSYHRASQGLVTASRKPTGCVFCPKRFRYFVLLTLCRCCCRRLLCLSGLGTFFLRRLGVLLRATERRRIADDDPQMVRALADTEGTALRSRQHALEHHAAIGRALADV